MHPSLRQTPPMALFSKRTTSNPAFPALSAATYPAGPPPITSKSIITLFLIEFFFHTTKKGYQILRFFQFLNNSKADHIVQYNININIFFQEKSWSYSNDEQRNEANMMFFLIN